MAKVITENFRVQNAKEFYETFAGNSYYIMGSSYKNDDGDVENTQNDKFNFLRRVIFGTKVAQSDLRFLFEKRLWISGTVYDEYDDIRDISELNMYVTVLEGTVNEGNYRVYKCIKNNSESQSTVIPSAAIFEQDEDGFFFTSDGYFWKYMFEIKPSEYTRHQTIRDLPYNPIPDAENTRAIRVANDGIYNVKITENNVFAQNLFQPYLVGLSNIENTIQVGTGFISRIRIESIYTARAEPNSYVGMYLIVDGQVYDIFQSSRPAGYNDIIEITTQVNPNPTNTVLNCQILPKIKISRSNKGASSNTLITNISADATAHGILNSNGRLIDVQMVNYGGGYTFATAKLELPSGLSTRKDSVSLRPVISPRGGHGSDPILEMAMSNIGIVTNIISSNDTDIPGTGSYTKLGLVRGPQFNSDVVQSVQVTGSVSVTNGGTAVVGVGTIFTSELDINDIVVIQNNSYIVKEIRNNTELRVALDRPFPANASNIPMFRLIFPLTFDNRKVITAAGNLSSAAIPQFFIEQVVYPDSISNREVLTAVINSAVYDGENDVTTLFVTDYSNDNLSDFLFGDNSPLAKIKRSLSVQDGINFRINSVKDGAYVPLSGSLHHFADFSPITRQNDTTEKIKFIFDF